MTLRARPFFQSARPLPPSADPCPSPPLRPGSSSQTSPVTPSGPGPACPLLLPDAQNSSEEGTASAADGETPNYSYRTRPALQALGQMEAGERNAACTLDRRTPLGLPLDHLPLHRSPPMSQAPDDTAPSTEMYVPTCDLPAACPRQALLDTPSKKPESVAENARPFALAPFS